MKNFNEGGHLKNSNFVILWSGVKKSKNAVSLHYSFMLYTYSTKKGREKMTKKLSKPDVFEVPAI